MMEGTGHPVVSRKQAVLKLESKDRRVQMSVSVEPCPNVLFEVSISPGDEKSFMKVSMCGEACVFMGSVQSQCHYEQSLRRLL